MHCRGGRISLLSATNQDFFYKDYCAIFLKLPNKRFDWQSDLEELSLNELCPWHQKSKSALFDVWFDLMTFFFWTGWWWHLPRAWLLLFIRVVTIAPWHISSNDIWQKILISFKLLFQSMTCFNSIFLILFVQARGTNLKATLSIPKSSAKTRWTELQDNPLLSDSWSIV